MKRNRITRIIWAGVLSAVLICAIVIPSLAAERVQPPAAPDVLSSEIDIMEGDVPLGALPGVESVTVPSGPSPLLIAAFVALAAAPLLSLRGELARAKRKHR